MKRIALWTVVVIIALVFYYSFGSNAQKSIAIFGSKSFRERVEKGLGFSHVRFVVKNSGKVDAIFSEASRTCEVHGVMYHLDWKESVKDWIKERFGYGVTMLPVFNDEIDKDWVRVYSECGKIIKGRISMAFENGWLIVKVAVYKDGELVAYYDPISEELIEPAR